MSSGGPSQTTVCLLTASGGGYFSSKSGTLQLAIKDVKGTTQLNAAKSLVWDITGGGQTAVDRTCTSTSFSFKVEANHIYHVHLSCMQLPPYTAQAQLLEACGQALDTIDVTNAEYGMVITS